MSLNEVMGRLKSTPPKWSLNQRLAIALMRGERQVKCANCKLRMRPCRVFLDCKESDCAYFEPTDRLMALQIGRVEIVISEINKL